MICNQEASRLVSNPIKEYEWGSTDKECMVAKLDATPRAFYAELWMGMHPNGQSQVTTSSSSKKSQPLSAFLENGSIPPPQFLFKVLSISKCLSIQVHPSQAQAQSLHASKPAVYLDPNDKPEMFYTLTPFQCFLGYLSKTEFGQTREILQKTVPGFRLGEQTDCRSSILHILSLSEEKKAELYEKCVGNLHDINPLRYAESSIQGIVKDFPNDIGVVISLYLDYKKLGKGECFYIGAGTPHAYIKGECLEIMRNSDNVCRLGLTPKFKDLEVIKDVLGQECTTMKVDPKENNQLHRFRTESQLVVSGSEFYHENLYLHNFSYSNDNVEAEEQNIMKQMKQDVIECPMEGTKNPMEGAKSPIEGAKSPIEGVNENEISHPKEKEEYLTVYTESVQILKFGVIMQGTFGVKKNGGHVEKFEIGNVIVFEPSSTYQISVPKSGGKGFMSVGWQDEAEKKTMRKAAKRLLLTQK